MRPFRRFPGLGGGQSAPSISSSKTTGSSRGRFAPRGATGQLWWLARVVACNLEPYFFLGAPPGFGANAGRESAPETRHA
jgi:hypothetical protein